MHNYQDLWALSNIDLFSAITGALAYFMLALVDFILVTRRVLPHSNIWLAQGAMFLFRGVALTVTAWNHYHPVPEMLSYSRLAASSVSICVAVFHVIVLPELLRWFRTRKEELAMATEVISEIKKANELSSLLAGMNYDRASERVKALIGNVA